MVRFPAPRSVVVVGAPLGFTRAVALASVFTLSSWFAPLAAQSFKLNGPLAQPRAGDVQGYLLSPNGARLIYRADQASDEVFELYSAPANGAQPALRLSAPLPLGGDVQPSFSIASSGRVVYLADQNTDDVFELFSVPVQGGAGPVRLNDVLASGGDVVSFAISPDGSRVAYIADQVANERFELFSAPIGGSALPIRLLPDLSSGSDAHRAWVSPGGHVVVETSTSSGTMELYSVPIDGSQGPVLLAEAVPPDGFDSFSDVFGVKFTSDGSHAVCLLFLHETNVQDTYLLFSVPVNGGQTQPLNVPALSTLSVFSISPDNSRVVYLEGGLVQSVQIDGTQRVTLGVGTSFAITPSGSRVVIAGPGGLTSHPIGSSLDTIQLSGPGMVVSSRIEITPNSSSVLFVARSSASSFRGLYAVPTLGGQAPHLLNGPTTPAGLGVAPAGQLLELTPDGARVVYRADQANDEEFELFSVPINGSQPPERLSDLQRFGDVQSFLVGADLSAANGQGVVYLADQESDETLELFGVPAKGGSAPVRYNDPLPGGAVVGDVLGFRATSDGSRAIYRADQDSDEVFELYSVRTDLQGDSLALNQLLLVGNDVWPDFALSASGEHVVYQAGPASGAPMGLFCVPSDGQQPAVELDSDLFPIPFPVAITSDDARVVYRKATLLGNEYRLFSAPHDGSAAPVRLDPVATAGCSVEEFQLQPGGTRAVYRADQETDGVFELFSVPADGSAPPIKLNPSLVAGGAVTSFRISPDGTRVVYLADQAFDERIELFSVPIDGSRPPHRLNGALGANGDVAEFLIAPGGRRVVYSADQTVSSQLELYSVPIDGPYPPLRRRTGEVRPSMIRLTPLSSGSDVEAGFQISADGRFVIYLADALTNGVVELFSVPIDGSTSPFRLNGPLVSGGDVASFALSPDQSRIIYIADQRVDGVDEIFSVAAGAQAVALDDLPVFADVESFQIALDSSSVVYLADRNANGVQELFSAPLDGSAPPETLSRALPTGGDVQSDYAVISGGRTLYRADQETDNVFEFYLNLSEASHHLPAPTPTRTVLR